MAVVAFFGSSFVVAAEKPETAEPTSKTEQPAEDTFQPSARLNGLFLKLISKEEKIRLAAMNELAKSEGDELKEAVLWLSRVNRIGIFASKRVAKGYEFVNSLNLSSVYGCAFGGYRYNGIGFYGYGSGYRFLYGKEYGAMVGGGVSQAEEKQDAAAQLEAVAASQAFAHQVLVAMGPKAVDLLIADYKEIHGADTLKILERIADRHSVELENKGTGNAVRKQVYTFLASVYLDKANEAEKE